MLKKIKRKKQKGQITIFVVMTFVVLFTLFGMTVSISMFIHDKINLQNSTDLASYYVATKQAELLGAIAHTNYQIRQSWKLLAFRYRVLANASRSEVQAAGVPIRHPGTLPNYKTEVNSEEDYLPAKFHVNGSFNVPPRICIWSMNLFKDTNGDSLCKTINFSARYIQNLPIIIGTQGTSTVSAGIAIANNQITQAAQSVTYANWWFAHAIVGAHKFEQRDRRAIIEELAKNLARPIVAGEAGMLDISGDSVFEGARKTFLFNLSESNRESFGSGENETAAIRFTNSLEGLSPDQWLAPIYANISLPLSTYTTESSVSEVVKEHANSALADSEIPTLVASSAVAQALKARVDPSDLARFAGNPARDPSNKFNNISLGVEKNPWFMVYNKAEAQARSTPVFLMSSFGEGIGIFAQAYSKPFGGRVGPWYTSQWPSGSSTSSGGTKVDALYPERVSESQLGAFGSGTFDPLRQPNFSRFPGDQKGLTTRGAMVAYGPILGWKARTPAEAAVKVPTSIQDYVKSFYSYMDPNESNDPLAQDMDNTASPEDSYNRRLEISAVAPDAFDVTHYSISPAFFDYYINGKLNKNNWLASRLPALVQLRGDLGAAPQKADLANFDVLDQLSINDLVQSRDNGRHDWEIDRSKAMAAWRNSSSLVPFLTAWNSGSRFMSYVSADNADMEGRFGLCEVFLSGALDSRVKVPSECLKGGRVGYSVKMISRDYLEADHPIGGGGLSGPLLNVR